MIQYVLDLGTNTFHLLIAEVEAQTLKRKIYQERQYVFLGESGFTPISEQAIERARRALHHFSKKIADFSCERGLVMATEGIRKASNMEDILRQFNEVLVHPIQVITGEQEAQLVGQGVISAGLPLHQPALALDIGGGSLELVFLQKRQVIQWVSLPLGLSVLHQEFFVDPSVSMTLFDAVKHRVSKEVTPFLNNLPLLPREMVFVGISGSFEVIPTRSSIEKTAFKTMDMTHLPHLIDDCVRLDMKGRLKLTWLPPERATYILSALAIIDVFGQLPFKDYWISSHTLKEGALTLPSF